MNPLYNFNAEIFAERIKIIRKEMTMPNGRAATQDFIAEKSGLKQNHIFRMESGKGTSIENIFTYLNFLYSEGFNINWIIVEENDNISKYKEEEGFNILSGFLDKDTFLSQNDEDIQLIKSHLDDILERQKSTLEELNIVKSTFQNIIK